MKSWPQTLWNIIVSILHPAVLLFVMLPLWEGIFLTMPLPLRVFFLLWSGFWLAMIAREIMRGHRRVWR